MTQSRDAVAVGHAPSQLSARRARLIAFFLPQFHPIPENDVWWGPGFTEWRNVAKARSLFPGHYQPHLPADLGFYDLRVPETRRAQADLARAYGIEGFCYWHYWFNGRRLLERPFAEVLSSLEPDFPFCLAWANEPWSRRWDGMESEVLQPQSYSTEDDVRHIRWLLDALSDPRAIRIDGRPVFLVYRPLQLPDPSKTAATWRDEVARAGLPGLYLIAVESGGERFIDPVKIGFDATVMFQPHWTTILSINPEEIAYRAKNPLVRLRHLVDIMVRRRPPLRLFDYQRLWRRLIAMEESQYQRYQTVFCSWDNTPRRGDKAFIVHNSSPQAYGQWLDAAIRRVQSQPVDRRVVFINAWNEWAEGAHLEPDMQHGRAYLEATRRAVLTDV